MRKFILLFLLCTISSCGIRGDLSKPADAKYPRTYPKY